MILGRMGQESEDMTMVLVKKRDNAGRFYLMMSMIKMQEEENSHHLKGNCENIDFLLFLIPACVTSLCPQEQP